MEENENEKFGVSLGLKMCPDIKNFQLAVYGMLKEKYKPKINWELVAKGGSIIKSRRKLK
jgi:hypothetical protein